jgi:hypothetical protein
MITWGTGDTTLHEFGHSVGLGHVKVPRCKDNPNDAKPLDYTGVGGVYYQILDTDFLVGAQDAEDVMSYCPKPWTSPVTWRKMLEALTPGRAEPAQDEHALRRPLVTESPERRPRPGLLVTGFTNGQAAVVTSVTALPSLVPDARVAPRDAVGTVEAFGARGRRLAVASIGRTSSGRLTGFAVVLDTHAAPARVDVMSRSGSAMARVSRSRHAPKARFVGLLRTRRRSQTSAVRWSASDRDRDRLRSTLFVQLDGHPFRALAVASPATRLRLDRSTIGNARRLRLRLVVGDGLNSTKITSRVIRVVGR